MNPQPKIYTLATDTKDGTEMSSFFDQTARDEAFLNFCKAHWDEDTDGPMPADPFVAYEKVSEGHNYATLDELDFSQHPLFAALKSLLTEVISHETDSDGDVILPFDRMGELRHRIHLALGVPYRRDQLFGGLQIDQDTSGEPIVWENQYECECGETWTDEWSCQCDDECPSCGKDISPISSRWIGPEEVGSEELWASADIAI